MQSHSIFDHGNYKDFLRKWLDAAPRGALSKMAASGGMQVSFLSQVLTRKVHLSREQSWQICRSLGLSELEQKYFMTLLDLAKAQQPSYRENLLQELKALSHRRLNLKDRFPVADSLSEEQKSLYFSSYLYSSVHLLIMIPSFSNKSDIAHYLKISVDTVSKILRDLVSMRILEEKNDRYRIRKKRIHLSNDASMIIRHHTNWRLRALSAIERNNAESLHYSSLVTISDKDAHKLKSMMVDLVGKFGDTVKDSKSERCFVFNTDFFELGEK